MFKINSQGRNPVTMIPIKMLKKTESITLIKSTRKLKESYSVSTRIKKRKSLLNTQIFPKKVSRHLSFKNNSTIGI